MTIDPERAAHERAMDEAAGVVIPLADLLAAVEGFLRHYVVVSDAQAAAMLTLWVAHPHAPRRHRPRPPYLHVTKRRGGVAASLGCSNCWSCSSRRR